jgi:hypothetical protein
MIRNIGYLLSFPEVSTNDMEVYVDCAISLLENNYLQDSICNLAGYSPPYNYFEIKELISKAKSDLNLPNITGDKAVIAFTFHLSEKLISDENKIKLLNRISNICIKNNYQKNIYEFYHLYFGYSDLLGEGEPQYYHEDLTLENANSLIEKTAIKWIEENKILLNSVCPLNFF